MKYFLDTNIFLRFLITDNKKAAEECKKFFKRIEAGKIKPVCTTIVLAEIVWVLQSYYSLPKDKVIEALRVIMASNIEINDDLMDWGVSLSLFERYNVKFIDCLIASCLAGDKDIKLVSYDKDFDKLGVKRVEPGDLTN